MNSSEDTDFKEADFEKIEHDSEEPPVDEKKDESKKDIVADKEQTETGYREEDKQGKKNYMDAEDTPVDEYDTADEDTFDEEPKDGDLKKIETQINEQKTSSKKYGKTGDKGKKDYKEPEKTDDDKTYKGGEKIRKVAEKVKKAFRPRSFEKKLYEIKEDDPLSIYENDTHTYKQIRTILTEFEGMSELLYENILEEKKDVAPRGKSYLSMLSVFCDGCENMILDDNDRKMFTEFLKDLEYYDRHFGSIVMDGYLGKFSNKMETLKFDREKAFGYINRIWDSFTRKNYVSVKMSISTEQNLKAKKLLPPEERVTGKKSGVSEKKS